MKSSTSSLLIAYFFVALFLYTGISKLMDFYVFREQIGLSPLLSPVADWIAIILPSAEIITAILLFVPITRRIALFISLILMIGFTGYIIYILNFNEHLPCTCGGVLQALSWKQHLILNICLILLALTAYLMIRRQTNFKIRG